MKQHGLAIRRVLIGLGAFSILIVAGLTGFGLLGIQRQLDARKLIVVLDRALHNHSDADAFMDDIRADVLRALQFSTGANKEGDAAIRTNLEHHIEVITNGIADNIVLPLAPDLHARYLEIGRLAATFVDAGREAVELVLRDPVAGARNYEHFRHGFSALEDKMDVMRDLLRVAVDQVRRQAAATAAAVKLMIEVSAMAGIGLLALLTAAAVRIAGGIATDLADSREEAQRLSLHDALTGLANRTHLAERLPLALAHAQRNGSTVAILCVDLDRFKQVNDTLGHPAGDALLRAVANRLRECVRQSDTVARLGGDEFAVIQAPGGGDPETGLLARRIVEALSEPYQLGGHQIVIGASVGIALAPADAADADGLLKMADMALYRAKVDGRGTSRFFEPGMNANLQERRLLELELREAIAKQQFELHYQPLVELASGRVDALEALVRWRHPRLGLLAPGEFIPLAEETGSVVPLGAWVLARACADAAGWPAEIHVAVNVAAAQFKGAVLIAAVEDALAAAGLSPERLELEITETALLADAEATLDVLRVLRAKGVRIAMDDFGTGYSSLGYLRSFPFDKIKIDRCFVQDIETSADCKAIMRAIIGLGMNLGIATTAEGVETPAQLEQVRAEGCDQIQGFLFSRPVPAADVAALLFGKWASTAQIGVEAPAGGYLPHLATQSRPNSPPMLISAEADRAVRARGVRPDELV